jgi:hypothetical protein
MKQLLERLRQEPSLKEAVRIFTDQAIDFTNQTGEIIDVVGKSNVRVYKEDEEWKFLLADPVYAERVAWRDAQSLVPKAKATKKKLRPEVLRRQTIPTVNALNYARLINSLAAVSDNDRRLKLEDIGAVSSDILHDFQALIPKKHKKPSEVKAPMA